MDLHRHRVALAAALTGLACLGVAADASARRHTDCKSRSTGRLISCRDVKAPAGPLRLSIQTSCHTQNVLAYVRASDSAKVAAVQLRLDGELIGVTTPKRPDYVAVGVDCSSLVPGEHALSASLRNRDGSKAKAVVTFTRIAGPQPDTLF